MEGHWVDMPLHHMPQDRLYQYNLEKQVQHRHRSRLARMFAPHRKQGDWPEESTPKLDWVPILRQSYWHLYLQCPD